MNQEGMDDRWEDIFAEGGEGCWEWGGAPMSSGYGLKTFGGKRMLTHRLSFELANGRKPVGVVRHTCDNRMCYRPSHLVEGSRLDNSQDMVERNRSLHGARHANAKLTPEEVMQIKDLHKNRPIKVGEIAEAYGISRQNIANIVNGRIWTDPRSFA